MTKLDFFLWGILPYMVAAVLVTATLWRYAARPFSWTSKSSEMLEKRILKWGSVLFHYGLIAVLIGHAAGLLVPISVYHALGVPDETYHLVSLIGGLPAGIVAFAGVAILLIRRLAVARIRSTSSAGDWTAIATLLVVIGTGLWATSASAVSHTEFDYRTTINPWLRGLLVLQPDPELMAEVPLRFKLHILTTFALYLVFPFTRLVHVFSLPLRYLQRSYVVYRRRGAAGHPGGRHRKGAV